MPRSKRTIVTIITLVVAIPAFFLGPQIWSPVVAPPGTLIPFYAFLAAIEALLLGLGVCFLIWGFSLVWRVFPGSRMLAFLVYLSIGWQLVSWWPHDNLHAHIGMDFQKLLGIEYGFHLTLMISSAILAYAFLKIFRSLPA